jgi:hypothetical protein
MSAISDNEQEPPVPLNASALKAIKRVYESEIGSEGEEESKPSSRGTNGESLAKLAEHSEEITRLKGLLDEREEDLRIVSEELVRVNGERIEHGRDLDICQERLDLVLKEARLNAMKLNAEKRESELLLQRYTK